MAEVVVAPVFGLPLAQEAERAAMHAATGTARNAPSTRSSVAPTVTATITTKAGSCNTRPVISGSITLPSGCCTTTISATTASASAGPPLARATSTASSPVTIAPM